MRRQVVTWTALLLTSCGGGGGNPGGPGAPPPSSVATLTGVSLSAGSIAPSFQSTTTDYTLTVSNAITATTVSPTTTDARASVAVNGAAVVSGAVSNSIALNPGPNVVNVVVTAENSVTTLTYTITINRQVLSDVATLSGLVTSAGAISPVFQPPTTAYTVNLPFATMTSTVTPVTTDSNATVTVNSVVTASGTESLAILLTNLTTVIDVLVTAENGVATQAYTVMVNRAPPSTDATLANLTLSAGPIAPTFVSNSTDYTLTVANPEVSTTATPTTGDANATVTVNGVMVTSGDASAEIALDTRITTLSIIVTAEDGVTTQAYSVEVTRSFASFELVDPTPGSSNEFGSQLLVLDNGNVVVSDPGDSSVTFRNGAVHLFDSLNQRVIASVYGDQPGDRLGEQPITPLGNGNYVIVSIQDDDAGLEDAGAVRLIDGTTGLQIGTAILGSSFGDRLGSGGIKVLPNNNYLIQSSDRISGMLNAGSVRLIDGTTGVELAALTGSQVGSFVGGRVAVLSNNNYVVVSVPEDNGAIADAGSIRLLDGTTGTQIGPAFFGDQAGDSLGGDGITVLENDNFVVASRTDDNGTVVDAGSVRLFNGDTGAQIGVAVVGDQFEDQLGDRGVVPLAGNNYVIVSPEDDNNAIVDAGSIRLVDGTTGAQIVAQLGDQADDMLGQLNLEAGVVALGNGNYVIGSSFDDDGATTNAGSARLVDGSSGVQIGPLAVGDEADDSLAWRGITALSNSNYVVSSSPDNNGAIVSAGSVRLFDGASGMEIAVLFGDQAEDRLGSEGTVGLPNGNFVIVSTRDDNGAIEDAGSAGLVDGTTGARIGTPIAGSTLQDSVGSNGAFPLSDSTYLVATEFSLEGTGEPVGSIVHVDGDSGTQIGDKIVGASRLDLRFVRVADSGDGSFFIFGAPGWDNNGETDSGLVRLIVY